MSGWPLADPVACPGLFDLLVIITSRTWHDLALGPLVAYSAAVLILVAVVLLARAVHVVSQTIIITIAITLAAAVTAEYARILAPSPAATFAITIAAWLAVVHAHRAGENRGRLGRALSLLALLAATAPAFVVPVIVASAWLTWPRGVGRAALTALVVSAPAIVVQLAMSSAVPSLLACVVPHGAGRAWVDAEHIALELGATNPVATALSILGLFGLKHVPREMRRALLPLIAAGLWAVLVVPAQPSTAIASLLIVFWLLAAAGLKEVWSYAAVTGGGKAGTIALSIALVVLQVLGANVWRQVRDVNDGHERLTLSMMGTILGALPRGAGLVEEEAITSLLTRALPSRQRSPDRFHVVSRSATAVTGALSSSSIFALPRSQRVLPHLGFELTEPSTGPIPGLAEVRRAHQCTTELGASPTPVPFVADHQVLALVADDERSYDHVVIVVAGESPVPVSPLNWPRDQLRGIDGRMFDLSLQVDRTDFVGELRSYGLSSSVPTSRYASRVEAWRIPGAPLALPMALGAAPAFGIAKRIGNGPDQHLRLCPSIPYEVKPLTTRGAR